MEFTPNTGGLGIEPARLKTKLTNEIMVIGVGGGGDNAVNYMFNMNISDVDLVVCNTDKQVLDHSPVPNKLQIGEVLTKGLGTGCNPELGRKAAEESIDRIEEILSSNTELLFITAGMGGGTGTGASPVIAELAKKRGILTIAVVTLPFREEKTETMKRALIGISELKKHVDSMIIIDNENIYSKLVSDISYLDAFPVINDVLATAVIGISEIITKAGYINVDLNDVRMVLSRSGYAMIGIGKASGDDRAREAVEKALKSPLMSDCDLKTANSVLVNISLREDVRLNIEENKVIMDYINEYTRSAKNVKRGVRIEKSGAMEEEISITILVSGFNVSTLPSIDENEGKNLEDVIIMDSETGEDESDPDMDGISLNSIPNNSMPIYNVESDFQERYKDRFPEKPVLIVSYGDRLDQLEKPAYLRKGFTLD